MIILYYIRIIMVNISLAIVFVTDCYAEGPVIGQIRVYFILIWANLEIEHGIPTQTHIMLQGRKNIYTI